MGRVVGSGWRGLAEYTFSPRRRGVRRSNTNSASLKLDVKPVLGTRSGPSSEVSLLAINTFEEEPQE